MALDLPLFARPALCCVRPKCVACAVMEDDLNLADIEAFLQRAPPPHKVPGKGGKARDSLLDRFLVDKQAAEAVSAKRARQAAAAAAAAGHEQEEERDASQRAEADHTVRVRAGWAGT